MPSVSGPILINEYGWLDFHIICEGPPPPTKDQSLALGLGIGHACLEIAWCGLLNYKNSELTVRLRQLLAAAILLRYREPAVAPPFPPTCMPVPSVAPRSNIRNDTQKKKH